MRTSLFSDILLISVSTSLMIIGLLLLSPMLSKHYSAKWKYGVWLIVTIRLLLPFPFSFGDSFVSIPLPESSRIVTAFQENLSLGTQADISVISQPVQQDAGASNHTPSLMIIMALLWLSGVSLFLLYHVMSYCLFRKQALRWSNPLLSDRMVSKINQVSNEMNVKCSVIVLTSRTVPNPMLVGFYKPILFLPHDQYRDEDLEFIMKHELVHYKRHDSVYKLMLLIVQAIHWFNPFVWFMVREVVREIEISCDDAVVRKQDLAYRKRYCEAILSEMQHNAAPHVALITNFSGGKHTMKQRFRSILNMNEKRNGVMAFITVLILIGSLAILVACTNIGGRTNNAALKPGSIYSYDSSGEQVAVNDTGNSYSINQEGNVSISYQNGAIIAKTPLKLDTTGTVLGMGRTDTGFFISGDKTAIVYGFADGNESPLHVLVSDDRGETWNDYTIEGAKGYDAKFIGFTNKQDGWIVAGGSAGVGHSLNYVYQTSDGGKTWQELGNPNDLYAEHMTGAGFANKEIGFLGFRYYEDSGPVIYWTKDKGETWEKLVVSLPETFDEYQKTPLSPIFNGKEGLFPILLRHRDNENLTGTIYLSSKDSGLTWTYDASYDKLGNTK
ncbi:M56 family metallopeptidase [Paenibacillus sp. S150]|uniref:M56 family metallopeptidase n=1 Tax=Paenibacillus sp. S150 TaxID=2749826 RepID=UPI001C5A13E3|nr:M56 family metallopeptidase [Paenibacillus sp. S150]MBW4084988.1 hypothetical protein [Paenibacillus sp. S150]